MRASGPPADFLSRLAARTLGLGRTGVPRSPALFEPPAAPSEALDSPEESQGVRTAAPAPAPDVEPATAVPAKAATLAPGPAPVVATEAPAPALSAAAPPSPAEPAPVPEPRRNGTPRLVHAVDAGDATAAAWEEPEPLTRKRRDGPRRAAMVPAMPRPADREPDPVGARPAPPAAPAPAAAPGSARPAVLAAAGRPLTFAMPATIPFALRDGRPNASLNGAGAVLPRRDRRATPDREARNSAGPSVNITIGRVEVRAGVPAAAAPRPAPRPRSEAPQSLADYLKRRDRAR